MHACLITDGPHYLIPNPNSFSLSTDACKLDLVLRQGATRFGDCSVVFLVDLDGAVFRLY